MFSLWLPCRMGDVSSEQTGGELATPYSENHQFGLLHSLDNITNINILPFGSVHNNVLSEGSSSYAAKYK